MYACICKAVTVSEVHAAIDSGADSIESVGVLTRAGTDCSGAATTTWTRSSSQRCGSVPAGRARQLTSCSARQTRSLS